MRFLGAAQRSRQTNRQGFGHLSLKLKSLGVNDAEVDAVLDRITITTVSNRSQDISVSSGSTRHSKVLLKGVACLYERLPTGDRQIFTFQYPGDFCDLNRHVVPDANNALGVAALTECSVGIINHSDLDRLIADYPLFGLALWRAAMLEASILRERLASVSRQPALERIAHLVCEQLARRAAVGIDSAIVPLSQLDLADAVGLSIVHVSRTFKELQRRNLLVKEGRKMRVVDRARLALLASFDGAYLNMPQLLSDWAVEIDPLGGRRKRW